MDVCSKITRLLRSSYTHSRTTRANVGRDQDYTNFLNDSGYEIDPAKGSFANSALIYLYCHYLNGVLIACGRPPIYEVGWEVGPGAAVGFARMATLYEDRQTSSFIKMMSDGVVKSLAPPGCDAIGMPIVNGDDVTVENTGNVLQIKVSARINTTILDLRQIRGVFVMRPIHYFLKLRNEDPALRQNEGANAYGFRYIDGVAELATSAALSKIKYVSHLTGKHDITAGVPVHFAGGMLRLNADVEGVYTLEFFQISGDSENLTESVAPGTQSAFSRFPRLEHMHPKLRPHVLLFIRYLCNARDSEGYIQTDHMIGHISNHILHGLAEVHELVSTQLVNN